MGPAVFVLNDFSRKTSAFNCPLISRAGSVERNRGKGRRTTQGPFKRSPTATGTIIASTIDPRYRRGDGTLKNRAFFRFLWLADRVPFFSLNPLGFYWDVEYIRNFKDAMSFFSWYLNCYYLRIFLISLE